MIQKSFNIITIIIIRYKPEEVSCADAVSGLKTGSLKETQSQAR